VYPRRFSHIFRKCKFGCLVTIQTGKDVYVWLFDPDALDKLITVKGISPIYGGVYPRDATTDAEEVQVILKQQIVIEEMGIITPSSFYIRIFLSVSSSLRHYSTKTVIKR
jgi:hypothetical protein